jgi:DNA-binding NarL/FixJ family response regulator
VHGAVRAAWASGEALRRAGETDRARERLRAAEDEALARGLTATLTRIERSLRLLGEHRHAQRRVDSSGLTGSQREILALVAEGLSNDEIGRRLGVSIDTVKRQISLASQKLGASNRAHAAILASERYNVLRFVVVEVDDATFASVVDMARDRKATSSKGST